VRWFCEDLIRFLHECDSAPLIFTNPNWYRLDTCYVKQVDSCLAHHRSTLQSLFTVYAGATSAYSSTAHTVPRSQWRSVPSSH
jgi:hypothetical protein